ncbi:MAG: hypothetical protein K0S22_690 [Oscillospiraceae bacterium]|jgi:hypothetical protein|nr:hypothetical protein [Oscillospiraceae bacterium]
MKKIGTLLLAATLAASALTACAGNTTTSSVSASSAVEAVASAPADSQVQNSAKVKTGLAVLTTNAKSTDAGEKDGAAKSDSIVAAVKLSEDGKILACTLDVLQSTINFSKDGKILTDLATTFKTKQELQDEYGMKKVSKIQKEWYEQANFLSAYVIGKTVEEVKGIAVDEKGVSTDAELTASVTIKIPDYIAAIEKAAVNAVETSASTEDLLGLAIVDNIAKSKDAGEKDGLAQTYTTYAAVTVSADGKITSCVLDASQANVNFDAAGKITTDLSKAVKTKNELKTDYGMQKASKIGKEWYEQADAYAEYVVGKTADEVSGIAVDDNGKTTDSELLASVTVGIGDFNKVVAKAVANAE